MNRDPDQRQTAEPEDTGADSTPGPVSASGITHPGLIGERRQPVGEQPRDEQSPEGTKGAGQPGRVRPPAGMGSVVPPPDAGQPLEPEHVGPRVPRTPEGAPLAEKAHRELFGAPAYSHLDKDDPGPARTSGGHETTGPGAPPLQGPGEAVGGARGHAPDPVGAPTPVQARRDAEARLAGQAREEGHAPGRTATRAKVDRGRKEPESPDEIRRDIAETRDELGDTVEALAGRADVKGRASRKAHEAGEQAKAATHLVREQAGETAQRAVRNRPAWVGAVAAVLGAVVVTRFVRRRRSRRNG
ncbi:DUF3618 domain-containing protein [Bailinhaonella thermotolerans]|uniref:DUF3618 domain-containing protein n=1 Tax=Bailinhaonella thermotolerans TaxID=1070861 RepID=UPI00192A3D1C|nr:DUF3618 domain-containing protein [Bailinhaonella thermotolerans]